MYLFTRFRIYVELLFLKLVRRSIILVERHFVARTTSRNGRDFSFKMVRRVQKIRPYQWVVTPWDRVWIIFYPEHFELPSNCMSIPARTIQKT